VDELGTGCNGSLRPLGILDTIEPLECSAGAVRYACKRIAADNESPFSLKHLSVPSFSVGGTPLPAVEWSAVHDEEELVIELHADVFNKKPGGMSRLSRSLRFLCAVPL
jgi:hypothetical protein